MFGISSTIYPTFGIPPLKTITLYYVCTSLSNMQAKSNILFLWTKTNTELGHNFRQTSLCVTHRHLRTPDFGQIMYAYKPTIKYLWLCLQNGTNKQTIKKSP